MIRSVLPAATALLAFLLPGGAVAEEPGYITAGDEYDTYSYTAGNGKTYSAKLPKDRAPSDYTPVGFTRQPSFIRGGGMLNKREHALVFYLDGDLIPQPLMIGYRYGLLYWIDVGLDIGADYGAAQALAHFRIENIKTRRSEAFFWANAFKFGYKHHAIDLQDDLRFDDDGLVLSVENSLAYRLGEERRSVLYLLSTFYVEWDMHANTDRQTDLYLIPASLGIEAMVGDHANFFLELGMAYSINGTEFADGSTLYEGDWFPVFKLGTALRTGSKTAVYYARETAPLSRGAQPKPVR